MAEPVGALGFFTRAGHVGTYLSGICPDGTPIRMRVCLPGESGGAVIRSARLSEKEDDDWAIVPFEEYLHGFALPDLAPLIGTRKLQRAVEGHDFNAVFSRAMTATDGAAPQGAVEGGARDALRQEHVRALGQNCPDQAKGVFDLILPHTTGDRTSGITMQTPKGLAKALVSRALAHPELNLRVRRYAQIPGTFSTSRDVRDCVPARSSTTAWTNPTHAG